MRFIGYRDNRYYFICHTQGNVIFCSTHAIFNEKLFLKCTDSHAREYKLYNKLLDKTSLEIELLVSDSSGKDGPAPIPIPYIPIPPTYSPSYFLSYKPTSLLLTLEFKKPTVDIEENDDVNTDVEMQLSSP